MSEDVTHNAIELPNVEDLINQAIAKDYNGASKVFGDIMTIKMNDTLDQEKIRLADQIFNGAEDEDEADIDDEQLELDLETEGELESDEEDDSEEYEEYEEEDSLEDEEEENEE